MSEFFKHRKIEDEIADRDADTCAALRRREDPERKILDRKMRIGRNVDERFHRQTVRRSDSTLQEFQGAQIFARLVEAATAKRSHQFAMHSDAVGRDLPFAPRERCIVEKK